MGMTTNELLQFLKERGYDAYYGEVVTVRLDLKRQDPEELITLLKEIGWNRSIATECINIPEGLDGEPVHLEKLFGKEPLVIESDRNIPEPAMPKKEQSGGKSKRHKSTGRVKRKAPEMAVNEELIPGQMDIFDFLPLPSAE